MEHYYLKYQDKKMALSHDLIIGADPCCHIQTQGAKYHCQIKKQKQGDYILKSLDRLYNTSLNGKVIQESRLIHGDEIQIGKSKIHFFSEGGSHYFVKSKNYFWNEQLKQMSKFAKSSFPVLISGPSGAGKELLSQHLHKNSEFSKGAFLSINCSAFSENLIESELFGHRRGSFTNATVDRKGAFEEARGGTLFLDEIGDMPLHLQPKLLRAIENQEIKPLGSDKVIKTNVRIISASHHDLREKIHEKVFREDLYFRLSALVVQIPDLKNRMEDFEDIVFSLAQNYSVILSICAIEELKKYHWPGNIRELKNIMARLSVIYSGETVSKEKLHTVFKKTPKPQNTYSSENVLKGMERDVIYKVLSQYRGNQRKTALALGIPKSTLNDRLKRYKIDVKSLKV